MPDMDAYIDPNFEMKSPKTDLISAAFAKAQAKGINAVLNCVNPHFKSRYADLGSIREATRPYSDEGISFTFLIDGRWIILRAELKEQFYQSRWPIAPGTLQAVGSQLTYLRRYLWAAMCAITADEDDDAEVAEASADVPRETKQRTAYSARKDKVWIALKKEMDEVSTEHGLRVWGLANAERIQAMPDSWRVHFREAYEMRLTELREGVTEEGKSKPAPQGEELKEKLKQSVEEEDGSGDKEA